MKDLIKLLYNTGNDLRYGSNKPHTVGQSSTTTYTLMQILNTGIFLFPMFPHVFTC